MLITTATDLPRLMTCIGSKVMGGLVETPPPMNPVEEKTRNEGKAVDWMIDQFYNHNIHVGSMLGEKASNGVFITDDMVDHVEDYIEAIDHPNCGNFIEQDTSHSSPGLFQVNGRADNISHDVAGGILYVDDMKYGYSLVDPEVNWTLISHAIGFCWSVAVKPHTINLSIFQPRGYSRNGTYRTWSITYEHLMKLHSQMIARLSNPIDYLQTSDHCKRCPSTASCPASRKAGYNGVDVSDKAFNETVNGAELSYEIITLQAAHKRIKYRLEALEDLAAHRINSGEVIPEFACERGEGSLIWKDGVTPETIQAMSGVKVTKPKPLTPKQAEKAGLSPALVNAFSHRPPTGLKLVQISATDRANKLLGKKG